MIAESHISLHVFPDSDEAFFDLFSCRFFDVDPVVRVLTREFGGHCTEQVLVARGQRYFQLRTERPNVLSHVNLWLSTANPGAYERMPKSESVPNVEMTPKNTL
jgi:hypothetical protein